MNSNLNPPDTGSGRRRLRRTLTVLLEGRSAGVRLRPDGRADAREVPPHVTRVDLIDEMRKKFEIVKQRQYGLPGENGVIHRVGQEKE